jgi:hypothetical protein
MFTTGPSLVSETMIAILTLDSRERSSCKTTTKSFNKRYKTQPASMLLFSKRNRSSGQSSRPGADLHGIPNRCQGKSARAERKGSANRKFTVCSPVHVNDLNERSNSKYYFDFENVAVRLRGSSQFANRILQGSP